MQPDATRRTVLALVLLLAGASACGGRDYLDDSAAFDRAYVPALVHTGRGGPAEAAAAVERLHEAWTDYAAAYGDYQDGEAWRTGFERVGAHVARADSLMAHGAGLPEVHEALEPVREELAGLRRAHGIDYVVDDLTAFHTSMEHVFRTVRGETAETLGAEEVARILNFYPTLKADWQRVVEAEVDPDRFALGDAGTARLEDAVAHETRTVEALGTALEEHDDAKIIEHGRALREGFVDVFVLFGAFEGETPAGT